jgi:hypothetical protein
VDRTAPDGQVIGQWHTRFSNKSIAKLDQLDYRLQDILNEAVAHMDFMVITGHRDEASQNEKFAQGLSKVRWPNSKHNSYPSRAVDIAPYPIDWQDEQRFRDLARIVSQVAAQRGVQLRWGGDWDMDGDTSDNTFNDLGHFELVS